MRPFVNKSPFLRHFINRNFIMSKSEIAIYLRPWLCRKPFFLLFLAVGGQNNRAWFSSRGRFVYYSILWTLSNSFLQINKANFVFKKCLLSSQVKSEANIVWNSQTDYGAFSSPLCEQFSINHFGSLAEFRLRVLSYFDHLSFGT